MNFSMNTRSSPKADLASLVARRKASRTSASSWAMRMPLPPPPAAAFSITGKPMPLAISTASSGVGMASQWPGTVGTPASLAARLAMILSPISLITSELGPTKAIPALARAWAKLVFSERKP